MGGLTIRDEASDEGFVAVGYEGEVQDLRTSEPVYSVQFVAQMSLLFICSFGAWGLLGFWEAPLWIVIFALMTALEKLMIHRLPDRISKTRFNVIRALLFINAVIFDTMPVYLWFYDDPLMKFGALAIVTGLILNNFNVRSRYGSILYCVQIPNALMFLAIAAGVFLQEGWSSESVATAVVACAIVVYFIVNLRDANLKEQSAASTREQLQHAQRVELLGRFAGGISHDFNNLLSVISGSLQLLKETDTDPERLKLIDQALNATDSGSALRRQMLAYGRRAPLLPEVIDTSASLRV